MAIGLVGRKTGMSRVFTDDGVSVPVTVIHAPPNRITRIKTVDRDGYSALQVTTGTRKPSRLSKPVAGQYSAVSVEPGEGNDKRTPRHGELRPLRFRDLAGRNELLLEPGHVDVGPDLQILARELGHASAR